METQNSSIDDTESITDCPGIILEDKSTEDQIQNTNIRQKRPKRILQFSDGEMAEYSSEDEVDAPTAQAQVAAVDPKSLDWVPWARYKAAWAGTKLLNGCDYVGEALADFLGITSPKYQFEIEEYQRLQAMRSQEAHKEDLEMGGWNESHGNNLITHNPLNSK